MEDGHYACLPSKIDYQKERDMSNIKTTVLCNSEKNKEAKMSIRAYKVKKIKYKESESFNITQDAAVSKWLFENTNFFSSLNADCCGLAELSTADLATLLLTLKDEMNKSVFSALSEDLAKASLEQKKYIFYYCF